MSKTHIGYKVSTDTRDYPIKALYDSWKDGDLILNPKFQRYKVWDLKKSSLLIESVFLNIIFLYLQYTSTSSIPRRRY